MQQPGHAAATWGCHSEHVVTAPRGWRAAAQPRPSLTSWSAAGSCCAAHRPCRWLQQPCRSSCPCPAPLAAARRQGMECAGCRHGKQPPATGATHPAAGRPQPPPMARIHELQDVRCCTGLLRAPCRPHAPPRDWRPAAGRLNRKVAVMDAVGACSGVICPPADGHQLMHGRAMRGRADDWIPAERLPRHVTT